MRSASRLEGVEHLNKLWLTLVTACTVSSWMNSKLPWTVDTEGMGKYLYLSSFPLVTPQELYGFQPYGCPRCLAEILLVTWWLGGSLAALISCTSHLM